MKKKVKSRSSTKYATSSDEASSSDDEDDLLTLFANLNMQRKEKLNELISAIHEKDDLLDTQEDFFIKENKKHVKVKNAYALEVENCEKLSSASDDEDDLLTLFANLNMQRKEKLNELISAIHEKDDLLDTQEDFFIKENKKHVKVKNAYALEVENCEKLSSELSTCHETIDNLRNENANLLAKVDSHVCNVSTSNSRDDNDDLLARIEELNISLASLRIENEKLLAKAKDFDVCNATISDLRTKLEMKMLIC